jgi:rod shape determining protein RodA
MNLIVTHFKRLDWIMILAAMLLVAIGLVSLYSSSLYSHNFANFHKQAVFLAIGFCVFLAMSFFDWRIFRESSALILILYFLSIAGLAGLYFFGSFNRGVRTWYDLGPVTLDPIELLKPVLLVLLAKYFSRRHAAMYQARHIMLTGAYVALPAALIFFQPNFGPCLVLFALWIGMLAVAGIKMRHFLALVLCGLAVFAFGWLFLMKDYQKDRILSFFTAYDPMGVSWSQNQAKIAVGTGGLLGKGVGGGSQTQYGFLSEPQTDFIFAAISEEFGILGAVALLALLFLLIWRVTRAALRAPDNFSRLFAAGFALLLFAEAAIHIGVNIGFLPIIGLPLPLVSYGGSNLIASLAILGVVEGIVVASHSAIAKEGIKY